jgi:hypothetical protein
MMAELRTTKTLAKMLASQPQIHDVWLDRSEKGQVKGIGGSDGLVGMEYMRSASRTNT